MDPSATFCPHLACPDKGLIGRGNIQIHSRAGQRYRCTRCGHTFTATTNTPFYRLRHAADLVTLVLTLLAHGCPIPAIVAAFALDERTVRHWRHRAGAHGEALHGHLVQDVAVGQVQADEIRARVRGGVAWMALALALPSRLWLGGVVSARRDGVLVRLLLLRVHTCARSAPAAAIRSGRPPWPLDSPIMSGPSTNCCPTASRRSPSSRPGPHGGGAPPPGAVSSPFPPPPQAPRSLQRRRPYDHA